MVGIGEPDIEAVDTVEAGWLTVECDDIVSELDHDDDEEAEESEESGGTPKLYFSKNLYSAMLSFSLTELVNCTTYKNELAK